MLQWLLDSDPAVRWQVLRDLTDASPDDVAAERAQVEREGWGARLLARQGPDGLWDGGALFPAGYTGDESGQPWTTTMHTLQTAADPRARPGVARRPRRDRARRRACALGARRGAVLRRRGRAVHQRQDDRDRRLLRRGRRTVVERVLGEQLADGGWNCEAENGSVRSSFDTTIDVLDGLLEHEHATGGSAAVRRGTPAGRGVPARAASLPPQEHRRDRRSGVSRRPPSRTTGTTTSCGRSTTSAAPARSRIPGWPRPSRWCARSASRTARWPLDRVHPGRVHFALDDGVGLPSRWNTLRALRVLGWWDRRS